MIIGSSIIGYVTFINLKRGGKSDKRISVLIFYEWFFIPRIKVFDLHNRNIYFILILEKILDTKLTKKIYKLWCSPVSKNWVRIIRENSRGRNIWVVIRTAYVHKECYTNESEQRIANSTRTNFKYSIIRYIKSKSDWL